VFNTEQSHRSGSRYHGESVAAENSQDDVVLSHLRTLGVALRSELDALAFLYYHAASLGTTAQIARLIGYDKAEIGAALHRLESLGLIQRSRASQGIRMYRFSVPPEPSRHSSLLAVMNLAQNRTGRLQVLKHLRRRNHEPQRKNDSGLGLA
jgi:predicted transcriptional regulator